jgi:hypothetical protein
MTRDHVHQSGLTSGVVLGSDDCFERSMKQPTLTSRKTAIQILEMRDPAPALVPPQVVIDHEIEWYMQIRNHMLRQIRDVGRQLIILLMADRRKKRLLLQYLSLDHPCVGRFSRALNAVLYSWIFILSRSE